MDPKKYGIENEDSDEEIITAKTKVISYGADYTLATLANLVEVGDIEVQPTFQRNFVWDKNKASKLIESFLLGYPVPNILLGQSENDDRMEVIDGQQRVTVICDFLKGVFNKESVFKLTGDITEEFRGKAFDDLDDVDKRRLRNQILKATILVYSKNNPDLKFSAFQRINTGSISLNQQEIRNCIFDGTLNRHLHSLNNRPEWRDLISARPDKRMRDEETILRYYAALYAGEAYQKSMTKFLNNFMSKNKNRDTSDLESWEELFLKSLAIVNQHLPEKPFTLTPGSAVLNRAVFEAVLSTVSEMVRDNTQDFSDLNDKFEILLSNSEFRDYCSSHTSDEKRYFGRMRVAREILK